MERRETLAAASFASLFYHLSVKEVKAKCFKLRGAMDICNSAANWREYIRFKYGSVYIEERGDLHTADDWIDLARGLEEECDFRYTAIIGLREDIGVIVEGTIDDERVFGFASFTLPVNFTIDGTFIRPNTINYICEIFIPFEEFLPLGVNDPSFNNTNNSNVRMFANHTLCGEWAINFIIAKVFDDPIMKDQYIDSVLVDLDPTRSGGYVDRTPIDSKEDILQTIKNVAHDPKIKTPVNLVFYFGGYAPNQDHLSINILWYPALKIKM